jgi:hypothetical protein
MHATAADTPHPRRHRRQSARAFPGSDRAMSQVNHRRRLRPHTERRRVLRASASGLVVLVSPVADAGDLLGDLVPGARPASRDCVSAPASRCSSEAVTASACVGQPTRPEGPVGWIACSPVGGEEDVHCGVDDAVELVGRRKHAGLRSTRLGRGRGVWRLLYRRIPLPE